MRQLKSNEKSLIRCLIYEIADEKMKAELEQSLNTIMVEDLDDGGMGSLHFVHSEKDRRKMGSYAAEKVFIDSDGIPIMVYLDLDQSGALYELDIWKVDFSPVIKYPVCK
jgi:hypothetical protein